eukprot:m.119661 g.119661  ORF g.119661 m.119661 type:complete len:717 (-) comp14532_c0_seq5:37-2187(-)
MEGPKFTFDTLGRSGVPGVVHALGPYARALITTPPPQCDAIAASAEIGAGRLVAVSHEGYISHAKGLLNGIPFWSAIVSWAGHSRGDGKVVKVGVYGKDVSWLASLITAMELQAQFAAVPAQDPTCDVVLWMGTTGSGNVVPKEADIRATEFAWFLPFMERGGGLIVSMCPWGFEQITGKRVLDESAQNHLLWLFGLAFSNEYASGEGNISLAVSNPERANCGLAMRAAAQMQEQGKKIGDTDLRCITSALRAVPLAHPELAGVREFVERLLAGHDKMQLFAKGQPVKATDHLAALHVTWLTLLWKSLPAEWITAAPNVELPPGPLENVYLTLDERMEGWISTGVYVPPGVAVTVQALGPHAGWRARIGCHTDTLWHLPEWRRWPETSVTIALDGPVVKIASPYGGLLYFEGEGKRASIHLNVNGVIRCPWFDSTLMADHDWPVLRAHPGPWGELVGKHIIFSMPSQCMRLIENPRAVLAYWDSVVASHFDLIFGSPPLAPARRERIVADVQISAGYMHSGYPIMVHLDQAEPTAQRPLPPFIDLASLAKEGNWGIYHELGHNRQHGTWTFDGTGEVTVNLFSLFSMERVCHLTPWRHSWLENQKADTRKYLQRVNWSEWKNHAGIALVSYAMLQRQFGWDPIAATMQKISSTLSDHASNQDKMDAWVKTLSLHTHHNLIPYYKAWGMPLSAKLVADPEVTSLPPWGENPAALMDA